MNAYLILIIDVGCVPVCPSILYAAKGIGYVEYQYHWSVGGDAVLRYDFGEADVNSECGHDSVVC